MKWMWLEIVWERFLTFPTWWWGASQRRNQNKSIHVPQHFSAAQCKILLRASNPHPPVNHPTSLATATTFILLLYKWHSVATKRRPLYFISYASHQLEAANSTCESVHSTIPFCVSPIDGTSMLVITQPSQCWWQMTGERLTVDNKNNNFGAMTAVTATIVPPEYPAQCTFRVQTFRKANNRL